MIIWSGELLAPDRLISCLQSLTEAVLNDESQLLIVFGSTFLVKNGSELWMRVVAQLRSRGVRIIGMLGREKKTPDSEILFHPQHSTHFFLDFFQSLSCPSRLFQIFIRCSGSKTS